MTEFGKVFKAYSILSKVDISKMTLQELFDHKFKIQRLQKPGIKLLDEIEARQINHPLKPAWPVGNYKSG